LLFYRLQLAFNEADADAHTWDLESNSTSSLPTKPTTVNGNRPKFMRKLVQSNKQYKNKQKAGDEEKQRKTKQN